MNHVTHPIKRGDKVMKYLRGKRIVWPECRKVIVEDFQVGEPKTKEVLIKMRSTLISSGTEGAFLMALPNTPRKFPQYPGGYNAGEVIGIGNEVTSIKVKDRVISGGQKASHVLIPEDQVLKIPSGLSFDEATFSNLYSTALQGVRKAEIELGDSVVILGQGLLGQLTLQLAKLSGATFLTVVDLFDSRLDISSKMGADYVLNPTKVDLKEEIEKITKGKGASVVFEVTGNSEVVPLSFELAGKFGRVVLLGSTRGESKVNFYSQIHKKGVVVIGAWYLTRPKYESFHRRWTMHDDTALVLNLLARGLIMARDLISLKLNFQEAPQAYRKAVEDKKDVLGIILDWT